jgi:hypothetical protein
MAKEITGELQQIFTELQALKPVKKANVAEGTKVLKSHMFVVEKLLAMGEYGKMNAWLVADGIGQDSCLYPDESSPSSLSTSLFTVLAAYSEKWGTRWAR